MIEKFRTPKYIFFIYMISSILVLMIFKFIFPGSDAPLVLYSSDWRLIQGALLVFNLFPALAFSALVIPFGIVSSYEETFQSFSEMFFKKLSASIILAILAAVIYGLIFFLALPVVKNKEETMRYTGELYRSSRAQMQERRDRGEWREAAQFLAICERIWYNNSDLADIKIEINRRLDEIRYEEFREMQEARASVSRNIRSANLSTLTGNTHPVNAAESMSMARAAFADKRYFDAHWLATLAGRLAEPGSPEVATSARLAADAWNEISSLAPNQWEEQRFRIFSLKIEGYEAMNIGDWIRAFYIFQELVELSPEDPDARNFLNASERGAKETAFFIDEIDYSIGELITGALFSLPMSVSTAEGSGRAVLRFSSLSISDDVAYGMDFEYMSFDNDSNLTASVQSRFAKITPFVLNNTPQVLILMHALDRNDENIYYNAEYLFGTKTHDGLILNISFEDLHLFGVIRKGLVNMQMDALFEAANKGGNTGYVHQIFQAEILNRVGAALFFLPMAIFVIVVGWRYRARSRPRYLFAIMLFVLPIVFNGFVFLYRSVFNTLGIWLVINTGFPGALTLYIVVLAASLFAALIALAAQHS